MRTPATKILEALTSEWQNNAALRELSGCNQKQIFFEVQKLFIEGKIEKKYIKVPCVGMRIHYRLLQPKYTNDTILHAWFTRTSQL